MKEKLTVGLAQISPIWLDRTATTQKITKYIKQAAKEGCKLVVFGEALLPGYPFWLEHTGGAKFNNSVQKSIHAYYLKEAIQIEAGHLEPICETAHQNQIAIYLGIIERPSDRGGHSLYCSLVYINQKGEICSVHRKLRPTYEERLSWSPGDGNGLVVHNLEPFQVGGLNCWENWMPLARASLYAQGENLHISVWPGSVRNTEDLTRVIAKESRSYVIAVSGVLTKNDIPDNFPNAQFLRDSCPEIMANGGTCLAAPDGSWVIEPYLQKEKLLIATIDHAKVREERQNFDPSGHYSRPDVFQLKVNRTRQGLINFEESD